MPRRWSQFRNPWDREYAMRGALWRGTSPADHLRAWIRAGTTVLELGCGDAKFVAGLAAAGYRPVGLDFSRHALRHARSRVKADYVLADLRRLPFRDSCLAAVAARYALGALPEPDRATAAQEIERVLKPGGVAFFEEFTTRDFRAGSGREVEARTFERNNGILTHYFETSEMPSLLSGLELVHEEEVPSRQRTSEGVKERGRRRWVLRRSA